MKLASHSKDELNPMELLIPVAFYFRFSVPVNYIEGIPKRGKSLLKLPKKCLLPNLSLSENPKPYAEIAVAWNEQGVGMSAVFQAAPNAKTEAEFQVDQNTPATSDGLHIWIDTRNTQSIHRASRYCHQFAFLPSVGKNPKSKPSVHSIPISRAKEHPNPIETELLQWKVTQEKTKHRWEAWIPAEVLTGFDAENIQKLGFTYHLKTTLSGSQYLTVNEDFPFASDPSLWTTLELIDL